MRVGEVGGTTATSGDHRVMVRGRQMVQLPVTSTAVMCCSVSPRCQLSAGPAVDIIKFQVSSYSDEDIEDLSPTSTLSLCSECRAGEDRATVCDLLT